MPSNACAYFRLLQAYTDMRNLTDLLREKPDVVDAPKAKVRAVAALPARRACAHLRERAALKPSPQPALLLTRFD